MSKRPQEIINQGKKQLPPKKILNLNIKTKVKILCNQLFSFLRDYFNRKVLPAIRHFIFSCKVLWANWNNKGKGLFIYLFSFLLLSVLFMIVIIGVVQFFWLSQSKSPLLFFSQNVSKIPISIYLLCVLGIFTLYFLLSFIGSESLIVLSLSDNLTKKIVGLLIKLLGALPTLILGNAVLVLSKKMGLLPTNIVGEFIYIISSLTLIGLPTTLQLGQEIIKDIDKKPVYQALSLGIGRNVIGKKIIMPGIKKTFNSAVVLSLSRILIEGYIVIAHGINNQQIGNGMLRNPEDLLDIFTSIYSKMTIDSNIYLILILFIIALFGNILSFSISSTQT